MQEGSRRLLKLESIGDCPRTNDGSHIVESPTDNRLPWCVQCGLEISATILESSIDHLTGTAIVLFDGMLPALEKIELHLGRTGCQIEEVEKPSEWRGLKNPGVISVRIND